MVSNVQPQPLARSATIEQTKEDAPGDVALWRDSLFWLTLALTLFAVGPFMVPGYFWGANDARHHVYFLFEFNRLVQDGIWWPRWSPDFAFGYGYPFFNIYGPFSHFLAELLLYFLHFSYTGAIKTVFALSIVGSGAAMYTFGRSWGGRHVGLVTALVYVYIPYHLLNLYVRANLAESMAFVWLPLCLWTVRQAIRRPGYRWIAGIAVSYAGLMLTSNLVIVLFSPFLGLYLVILSFVYAEPEQGQGIGWLSWLPHWGWFRNMLIAGTGILGGLGLSAIFWLPMVLERKYVRVDQWFDGRYDFHGNFVYFFQLFSPQWGFGISKAGPNDPIGFQLGVVPLVLGLIGIVLVWRQVNRFRWEIVCFGLGALGTAFLALQWSAPLWNLPLIGSVLGSAQFPWRWFSVTVLCISVLAGLIVYPTMQIDHTRRLSLPLLAIAAVIVLGSYPLLQVQIVPPKEGPVGLAALMRFQQSSDEMTGSTAWVKQIPKWSSMADEYISEDKAGKPVTPVSSLVDYTTLNYNRKTGFVVHSEAHNSIMEEVWYWSPLDGRSIVFNQFYYPGWKAYLLDGLHGKPVKELPIIPEETDALGRMTVPVPAGEGYVLLRFGDTPPRVIGRDISLATVVVLALGGLAIAARRKWGRPI